MWGTDLRSVTHLTSKFLESAYARSLIFALTNPENLNSTRYESGFLL